MLLHPESRWQKTSRVKITTGATNDHKLFTHDISVSPGSWDSKVADILCETDHVSCMFLEFIMLMDAGCECQDESGTLSRTYGRSSFFRSCEKKSSQGLLVSFVL